MNQNSLNRLDRFKEQIKSLPSTCGVYFFKNLKNQVIYVGAATSLVSRVSSYFLKSGSNKAQTIQEHVNKIDIIPTDTIQDAFLLEAELIKQYQPRFNIRLKDDKRYPYLKVTIHERFPRLLIVRELDQDGSIYFGPYSSKASLKRSIKFLRSQFPICNSKKPIIEAKKKIFCHDWDMGLCLGVCKGKISVRDYRSVVDSLLAFLKGETEKILSNLEIKMSKAVENQEFEQAAVFRDKINDLHRITEKKRLLIQRDLDLLYIVHYANLTMVGVLNIENQNIKDHLVFPLVHNFPQQIDYAEVIRQVYLNSSFVPETIIIPHEAEFVDEDLLNWLSKKRTSSVIIRGPNTPLEEAFLEKCSNLTLEALERESQHTIEAVEDLRSCLRLHKLPNRIEAFDISNLGNSAAVGSMVVFHLGRPLKSHYRRFRIKTVKGQDDFAMMGEVIRRRYSLHPEWPLPDLILIDGGKGQLSTAVNELKQLKVTTIPILGLAKKNEEIFVPGRSLPLILPKNSSALQFLQRIRDEAHRFAIGYHRLLREKTLHKSRLDSIPGIGKKRKDALLSHFGSVENVKQASISEIEQTPGISAQIAKIIYEHLHYDTED